MHAPVLNVLIKRIHYEYSMTVLSKINNVMTALLDSLIVLLQSIDL